ncbi:TonB family protein [Bdellovibrio bacteriovorus]|uniref:TonB family protein n=1 Tax=Bdellovibrio bacteriovorus TaxID=959 RepID=UPI0035A73BB0
MSAAKLLILENTLGQKVRTFAVHADSMNLVYLKDSRRVEAFTDLNELNENGIPYTLLQEIQLSQLSEEGLVLQGLGRVRAFPANGVQNSPTHTLAEEQDEEQLKTILQKTTAGHMIAIFVLLLGSWVYTNYFMKSSEPPLVTIMLPQEEPPVKTQPEARPHVKVSKTKIKQSNKVYRPIAKKIKSKPYKVNTAKAKDVRRVGALAALGGLKNGAMDAEGLDMQSLKNIRAAGKGAGGGGIGNAGRGGARGYMPGNGLIAGSAGEGARAQGAGGYGTKGSGGGRAGYGKISLVGGTSAVSLPLDEEVVVEGGLDQDQIQAVINRNRGQITYCYEKGLQGQPTLGGRVAVSFVIGAAGRITTAKVAETSLGSRMVENCMLQKMRTWQFPRPVGKVNVDVLYPFELSRVSAR